MKKNILWLILILLLLSACNDEELPNNNPPIEKPEEKVEMIISGDSTIIDVGFFECLDNDNKALDVVWSIDKDDIAMIDEDGVVTKVGFGNAVVTATLKSDDSKTASLSIYIEPTQAEKNSYFRSIEEYIRDNTETSIDEDIIFIEEVPNSNAIIEYYSYDTEYLSNEGAIKRELENHYVTVKVTIKDFNDEYSFNIPFEIKQIPLTEQYNNVKTWLDDNITSILKNESGTLPEKEGIYGNKISWLTNYPYIIDASNQVHKAYESTDIVLIAKVKIGGVLNEIKYSYTSKGVGEMEKAKYIDEILKSIIPETANKIINTAYTGNIDIIQDFIYPDEANRIRPSNGIDPHAGMKMPGGVQWIVIHDTGMTHPNDNAKRLNEYIHAQASNDLSKLYDDETMRQASWHFSIDDKEIYQHVPTDEVAWHAGDGSTVYPNTWVNNNGTVCLGGGNRNGIGIETCINPENDYILTLKRTAKLVATLLNQYGLGIDRIKQHYDFSEKNCPNVIRTYGYWEEFIKEVEFQLWIIKTGITLTLEWEIDKPEIINYSGKVNPTANDEIVTIKLKALIDGEEKRYEYKTKVNARKYT